MRWWRRRDGEPVRWSPPGRVPDNDQVADPMVGGARYGELLAGREGTARQVEESGLFPTLGAQFRAGI